MYRNKNQGIFHKSIHVTIIITTHIHICGHLLAAVTHSEPYSLITHPLSQGFLALTHYMTKRLKRKIEKQLSSIDLCLKNTTDRKRKQT
jgi:hypothetical protein